MGISPILANKWQNLVLGGTAFSANGTSVSLQLWDSGGSKAAYSGYADLSLDIDTGTADWNAASTVSGVGTISPAATPSFTGPSSLTGSEYPIVELRIYDGADLWWRVNFGAQQTGAIDTSVSSGASSIVVDNGAGATITTPPLVNSALILDSDPHTIYRITSVSTGATDTTLGISPNLAVNVSDGDAVTFLRSKILSVGDAINITTCTLRVSQTVNSGYSNAVELAFLNQAFRGVAYTPTTTIYADLYSVAPATTDGSGGTLTDYGSYAQKSITNNTTNFTNATTSGNSSLKALGVQQDFVTATGDASADVVAGAFWYESSRTNLIAVFDLTDKPVQSGDPVFIPTGTIATIRLV